MVQRQHKRGGVISAISWIPKGVSKSEPIVSDPPSKDEIKKFFSSLLTNGAESENEDAADADQIAQPDALYDDITLALNQLDMEHYDDEDQGIQLFSSEIGEPYYPSNDMDPYIIDNNDDDSEELEDMIIHPTDSVIVCACSPKDSVVQDMEPDIGDCFNHLEVSILEDSELNMYSHHKITIPSSPLCMAWLDCPLKGGEKGNFLAVGSMEPEIKIWDLDVIGELQLPCVVLGATAEEKRKGKKKSIKYKDDSHTDSVLGLAWNKEYRNILASASADKRVKIWDVVAGKCDITLEHHTDKARIKLECK
ncbi:WD40/YVTN repeat-like-containing domain superfamily [Sesbania bispinosa]|nr:WD40/YVTN repeat-like-containing domain superfamily [Sesbania bispinosa]